MIFTHFLPLQAVSDGVWYYYMISLSFYWSSTLTHFFETRRKDFWQMFSHHIVTVLLISLSWVCNIHRVGSLFMATHDCADIFLEAAKAFKYAKFSKACDATFAVFVLVWIATRLVVFPRILYVTLFQTLLPYYPVYFLLNSMLLFLLCLHLYWTYLILNILIDLVRKGEFEDSRSSSEDDQEFSDASNENAICKKRIWKFNFFIEGCDIFKIGIYWLSISIIPMNKNDQ